MKRYIFIITLALATTLSAAAQKTIEILHTNDTHSCIMPLNPNLADTLVAGRGGFIRRMEMIRQEREANPDVLLFDSGDFSQGSPYYTLFKGSVETELMSAMKFKKVVENIGDIIVRSNLADYAFVNSPTLYERQAMLLDRVRTMKDVFCTFSQGIYETTLVVSSTIVGLVDEIFADENNIAKTVDLSSITVKLPAENTICPGVYYYIFKELAWDNINITEVISTTNEFTVVISDSDIHRAFTILMEAKRQVSI